MLGALVGDNNGSIYQYNNGPKNKKFRYLQKICILRMTLY